MAALRYLKETPERNFEFSFIVVVTIIEFVVGWQVFSMDRSKSIDDMRNCGVSVSKVIV